MPRWNWRVASSSRGLFITFEGGEGAGKTTQIARLAAQLEAQGRNVVTTREPGGTPTAERLRDILLHDGSAALSAATQALTFYAARQDHLEKVIRPALDAGAIVLCDRFHDSTRAYQGAGGDADAALLTSLEQHVIGETTPDLTLLLDLAPALGLARAGRRGGAEDTFERKTLAFHERLRAEFQAIAAREPHRVAVVDAAGDADRVAMLVAKVVAPRLDAYAP